MSAAGDAQSDVMSGATLALMVLFVAVLLYLLLLLAVFADANTQLEGSLEALQAEEQRRAQQESLTARAEQQARSAADERDAHAARALALLESQEGTEAEVQRLRRQLEAARSASRKAARAAETARAAEAESEAEASEGGGDDDGNLVATGMRLWTRGGTAIITDAESVGGRWQQRWTCERDEQSLGSGGGGWSDGGSLGR